MEPRPLPPVVVRPEEGQLFKHYKGDLYRVITTCNLSEERETEMVVYRSMARGSRWARPLTMWNEVLMWPDGKTRRRFEPASLFSIPDPEHR